MRKSRILFLTIVLLLITTCSSIAEKEAIAQSAQEQETLIVYKLQKDTALPQLSKKDILATFKDKTDIKIFTNAMNTSEKISGIVNTASPNYEVTFQKDETEESYCLWINPNDSTSNAMYINKKDPYTAYKLSVNSTNSIKKLLVKTKNLLKDPFFGFIQRTGLFWFYFNLYFSNTDSLNCSLESCLSTEELGD